MSEIKLNIGTAKQAYSTNSGGVFYIDNTDVNVVTRFSEKFDELKNLAKDYDDLTEVKDGQSDEEAIKRSGALLKEIDEKIKAIVDYVFDDGVSEAVWGKSSAVPTIDHVFDTLFGLYTKEISKAAASAKQRISRAVPKKYQKH